MGRLGTALCSIILFSQTALAQLSAGQPFPTDIKLDRLLTYPALQLSDTHGKVTILDFWASWCEPCRAELPLLEKVAKKFPSKDVVMIAINLDENERDADRFLKATRIQVPVIRDTKRELTEKLKIDSLPVSFILDRNGKVVSVYRGYAKGDEKKISDQVSKLLK
mgnify:CR=1 FL=1